MSLKEFAHFKNWWTLLAAGGVVITAASVDRSPAGFWLGVACFLVGIGEWKNHKLTTVKVNIEGLAGFKTRDEFVWTPSVAGLIFDALGISAAIYLVWILAH